MYEIVTNNGNEIKLQITSTTYCKTKKLHNKTLNEVINNSIKGNYANKY